MGGASLQESRWGEGETQINVYDDERLLLGGTVRRRRELEQSIKTVETGGAGGLE